MAPRKANKKRVAAATVPNGHALFQGRHEFTDGYLEWEGFDENGDVEEGTGDVTSAIVDDVELRVNLDYDMWSYVVRMENRGERWEGTFRRMEGGRVASVGRCHAKPVRADAGERAFEGQWLENEISYKWRFFLRAPAGRAKSVNTSVPPAPRGVPLDRYARLKLLRLSALVEQVTNARRVEPATLKALLAAHDALSLAPK